MVAYGHYIQFIHKSEVPGKVEGSFSNIVTLKESSSLHIKENLKYGVPFIHNQGRDLVLYTDREFSGTQDGQLWVFEVKDVVTYFWHSGTMTIEYIIDENFTDELLKYWCLHIVLPIFFTLEETYDFIHAGAVEVMGKPILFVAESFGGKSTMTDFFLGQGHALVSDDKVGTYEKNGQFFAIPSHPHHRPYRKMEDLGYFVNNMSNTPKPIRAIYTLDRVAADAPISISELQGIAKFKCLRLNSEINFSFLKSKRFKHLNHLIDNVPVYKITVPWDTERLEEVYTAITDHCCDLH